MADFLGIPITEKIKPFIANREGHFLPPHTFNIINDVIQVFFLRRFVYERVHTAKIHDFFVIDFYQKNGHSCAKGIPVENFHLITFCKS